MPVGNNQSDSDFFHYMMQRRAQHNSYHEYREKLLYQRQLDNLQFQQHNEEIRGQIGPNESTNLRSHYMTMTDTNENFSIADKALKSVQFNDEPSRNLSPHHNSEIITAIPFGFDDSFEYSGSSTQVPAHSYSQTPPTNDPCETKLTQKSSRMPSFGNGTRDLSILPDGPSATSSLSHSTAISFVPLSPISSPVASSVLSRSQTLPQSEDAFSPFAVPLSRHLSKSRGEGLDQSDSPSRLHSLAHSISRSHSHSHSHPRSRPLLHSYPTTYHRESSSLSSSPSSPPSIFPSSPPNVLPSSSSSSLSLSSAPTSGSGSVSTPSRSSSSSSSLVSTFGPSVSLPPNPSLTATKSTLKTTTSSISSVFESFQRIHAETLLVPPLLVKPQPSFALKEKDSFVQSEKREEVGTNCDVEETKNNVAIDIIKTHNNNSTDSTTFVKDFRRQVFHPFHPFHPSNRLGEMREQEDEIDEKVSYFHYTQVLYSSSDSSLLSTSADEGEVKMASTFSSTSILAVPPLSTSPMVSLPRSTQTISVKSPGAKITAFGTPRHIRKTSSFSSPSSPASKSFQYQHQHQPEDESLRVRVHAHPTTSSSLMKSADFYPPSKTRKEILFETEDSEKDIEKDFENFCKKECKNQTSGPISALLRVQNLEHGQEEEPLSTTNSISHTRHFTFLAYDKTTDVDPGLRKIPANISRLAGLFSASAFRPNIDIQGYDNLDITTHDSQSGSYFATSTRAAENEVSISQAFSTSDVTFDRFSHSTANPRSLGENVTRTNVVVDIPESIEQREKKSLERSNTSGLIVSHSFIAHPTKVVSNQHKKDLSEISNTPDYSGNFNMSNSLTSSLESLPKPQIISHDHSYVDMYENEKEDIVRVVTGVKVPNAADKTISEAFSPPPNDSESLFSHNSFSFLPTRLDFEASFDSSFDSSSASSLVSPVTTSISPLNRTTTQTKNSISPENSTSKQSYSLRTSSESNREGSSEYEHHGKRTTDRVHDMKIQVNLSPHKANTKYTEEGHILPCVNRITSDSRMNHRTDNSPRENSSSAQYADSSNVLSHTHKYPHPIPTPISTTRSVFSVAPQTTFIRRTRQEVFSSVRPRKKMVSQFGALTTMKNTMTREEIGVNASEDNYSGNEEKPIISSTRTHAIPFPFTPSVSRTTPSKAKEADDTIIPIPFDFKRGMEADTTMTKFTNVENFMPRVKDDIASFTAEVQTYTREHKDMNKHNNSVDHNGYGIDEEASFTKQTYLPEGSASGQVDEKKVRKDNEFFDDGEHDASNASIAIMFSLSTDDIYHFDGEESEHDIFGLQSDDE